MDDRDRLAETQADTLLKTFVSYGLVRSINSTGLLTLGVSAQYQIYRPPKLVALVRVTLISPRSSGTL